MRDVHEIAAPRLTNGTYAGVVNDHQLSFDERAILSLALAPHLRPQALDPFLTKNPAIARRFTEFGGTLAGAAGGFRPTLETAAFILAVRAWNAAWRCRPCSTRISACVKPDSLR